MGAEIDSKALAGFECLSQDAHHQKGMRKPTATELTDALRQYPRARYQALTARQLVVAYQAVREKLVGQLADVSAVRQRMAAVAAAVATDHRAEPDPAARRLMPSGCATIAEAVDRF